MSNKIERLRAKLCEHNIDGALISSKENIRYYSNFTSEDATLLITMDSKFIITDFRYIEQCKIQCPDFLLVDLSGKKVSEHLNNLCRKKDIKKLWFEGDCLTFNVFKSINETISPTELIPDEGIPASLRMIKTPEEIESIEKAASIADLGFEFMLDNARAGMSEKDIALELEFFLRRNGSEGLAFDTIAASGANGAMPHAVPSDRKIEKGDMLTLDYGCVVNGYRSDMTRTIAFGEPSAKLREIYKITLDAQLKALDAVKPGVKGLEVDKVARDHITDNGYGEYFGHGLGHGVGLQIHEGPTLSKKGNLELQPGMVVTIEPGIYLPDVGGVRIEDLVVITDTGYKNLTSSKKDLIIL